MDKTPVQDMVEAVKLETERKFKWHLLRAYNALIKAIEMSKEHSEVLRTLARSRGSSNMDDVELLASAIRKRQHLLEQLDEFDEFDEDAA